MLIYYDLNTSPNCFKTKILLTELGLEYEQRSVDHAALRSEAYRAKFPTGFAPAIEDGDVQISESAAIALHLAERSGALVPKDAGRRARMYQAMSIECALLAPTVGSQGLFGELYKPEQDRHAPRIAELRARAQHVAHVLGAVLGERAFFADEFSIADIQLYAAVAKSIEGSVFEGPPSNLVAWHARMTSRRSVASAREHYVHYRRAAA